MRDGLSTLASAATTWACAASSSAAKDVNSLKNRPGSASKSASGVPLRNLTSSLQVEDVTAFHVDSVTDTGL